MSKPPRKTPTLFTKANGITFIRTVLLVMSMAYSRSNVPIFLFLYVTSMLLDMVDGYVSRYFNESTLVGALYDQLLDRMTSSYICFLNAKQYPQYLEIMYLVLLADVCGHWTHNYVCALYSNTNHKEVNDANFLLRVYYTNKTLMTFSIVMYEIFFCSMYVRSMYAATGFVYGLMTALMYISATLCIYKIITNILQGAYGCSRLLEYDRRLAE